jgi:hypothetical protein
MGRRIFILIDGSEQMKKATERVRGLLKPLKYGL